MVLKAMKCTPSVKNPLFYNINKIEQGEAELVAVRNIRSVSASSGSTAGALVRWPPP